MTVFHISAVIFCSCLYAPNSTLGDTISCDQPDSSKIRTTATKPQRSMDKEREMMMMCLLLAAICSPVLSESWKATVMKNLVPWFLRVLWCPIHSSHPKKKAALQTQRDLASFRQKR
ncbi:myeloid cell surface antigen CD33-like isoform X1 [Lates japonicus]|uniref:Myeloid cell surface antigen CD33-like isoform X1 n=1 Tax=Lates japonicus TaxID=270547 RepID=A0AAD3MGF4_LATJO|nr:myeloid cell surface antigen CD33-like isoform X1 [Lates japonicus]